jgi:predicted TIM-barrel enzyme
MADLEAVKAVLPDTPVLANTGVKHDTVADVCASPTAAWSARR